MNKTDESIPPAELRGRIVNGVFKFVKLSGNPPHYRFFSGDPKHRDMVSLYEIPIAAGTCFLFDTFFRIEEHWSSTLNIGCQGGEEEEISRLIGLPCEDPAEGDSSSEDEMYEAGRKDEID